MIYIYILLTKLFKLFINVFHLGSGLTWPGHLVLKLSPGILEKELLKGYDKFILIAGTNGKTTTSKLISFVLERKGIKVVSNKSGANLLNGIVTSLLLDRNIFNKPRSSIGIFEVDEFALPEVFKRIKPSILILLNLSRDQLDRYGETDIIFERWKDAINTYTDKQSEKEKNLTIIADIDQKEFLELTDIYKGKVLYFNDSDVYLKKTKLYGRHNAKNINACLVACELLSFNVDECSDLLSEFKPAYGRGETILFKGRKYKVFLAKNPTSFNNNLDLIIKGDITGHALLFILNDGIPDGRDTSWIYDIEKVPLSNASESRYIYVSGSRCYDMAVRLKHAGVNIEERNIVPSIASVVKELSKNKNIKEVIVLPNYSSMLDFRKVVLGRKIL